MSHEGRAALRRSHEEAALTHALALLRRGEVVALPTDTVYGIACDSKNSAAIDRLFAIKGRATTKAIPLLLSNERQLLDVTRDAPDQLWEIAARFWPGALTIVLPADATLPANLLSGGSTVAVRLPDSRPVRLLGAMLGRPLAVTSANLSEGPNSVTAAEVMAQLGDRLPLILDGGRTAGDRPSTVLDLSVQPARILREGPITAADLARWLDPT
ncbi:MAG: threonylcarbamoyl-AMP synthase [Anaerolineales bacterium]|nr:threonylcarbamoyl-AMP synthase [Anaerolineales bacterium]MCB9128625.1 threonylcarbamoyl-AMP synthase [Ardenticatenales bacterium]